MKLTITTSYMFIICGVLSAQSGAEEPTAEVLQHADQLFEEYISGSNNQLHSRFETRSNCAG